MRAFMKTDFQIAAEEKISEEIDALGAAGIRAELLAVPSPSPERAARLVSGLERAWTAYGHGAAMRGVASNVACMLRTRPEWRDALASFA